MRRRRGGGLVGCGRAAPAGVEVVLAGARAAPTAASRPGGRRRGVRVRVRLRGRVREAGGAVAIELQGGGRLVLGVQRVHEVRAHRGGGGGGCRGGRAEAARTGGRARRRQGARLTVAALPRGPLGRLLSQAGPAGLRRRRRRARPAARPARQSPLRPGSRGRWATGRSCPALSRPPPRPRAASRTAWRGLARPPALHARPASPGARRFGLNIIADAPGDLPRCLHSFLLGTRRL